MNSEAYCAILKIGRYAGDRIFRRHMNMDNKIYGYARVSTKEQHEDRQIVALVENGVPDKNIFIEHQSGKDFNRPKYQRLLKN